MKLRGTAGRANNSRSGARDRAADRPKRTANAFDRYSLALQLIQVFPVVSGLIVLGVARTWLAGLLTGVGLLAGTVWVVRAERLGGRRHPRGRRAVPGMRQAGDRPGQETAVPVVPIFVEQNGAVVRTEIVHDDEEIRISIRLHRPPELPRADGAAGSGPP